LDGIPIIPSFIIGWLNHGWLIIGWLTMVDYPLGVKTHESGLEVCMAADSPLANPQDLSTQIIRAADEVSWHQWDGEGFFIRAVHPESVGFPTEHGEILSIFFLKSKTSEGLQGLGYWSHRFFSQSW
jgi:hypothetical protein